MKPNAAVPNSMLEGLQMILGELGGMMATPDADVQFLTTLQHAIVGKIKQSTQHAISQQGPGGMTSPPPGLGAAGMGGGTNGLVNQQALQGAGGGGPSAPEQGAQGSPNPDEMRRILGANGVSQ
jgi:hypothetical protein